MSNSIKVIEEHQIEATAIWDIFIKNSRFPNKLFSATNFEFSIIIMDDYLFGFDNDENQEKIKNVVSQISKRVYFVANRFQEFNYAGISFDSNLTFSQLQQNLQEPLGSEVGTNWTDDYFFGEDSKWGIYHLHDSFCLIFGYERSLLPIIKGRLLSELSDIKPVEFFLGLITEYMNDEEKQSFINLTILNNPWLNNVKVYSVSENIGNIY